MAIINSIYSWLLKKRIHQIELFRKYPNEVQNELFLKLVDKAKSTEWGKKHDYKSIKSIEDYREKVPLQDYESLKEQIIRIKQGEQNVLWPTEIKWFAKSSGTTSDRSKFIPISKESLEDCHYKGGKDMLCLYYHYNPNGGIASGKTLVLGGSMNINSFSNNSFYGDLSSIIMKNLPFWVEYKRTPEMSIALMDNWEEKIEKMARSTMVEDVTLVSGVPSWMLVLMKKIMEIKGVDSIHKVWPNLELFIHGGVNFAPYRNQFEAITDVSKMYYQETYNASEGFFGIQDDLRENDMLLMLDYGIYYEFIPFESMEEENPKTLTLDEVEIGKNYAIVISTNGGLWRYKIGDTIKFTSKYPFKIQVSGRIKSFINAFGEEVIVDNADKAIEAACRKTNAQISDYTAAPIYLEGKNSGGHEWIIEFEKEPDNLEEFINVLDDTLREINSDYDAKRKGDMILKKLKLNVVPKGTFYNWLKSKNKIGGQHKIPRLSNDRKYIDEILKAV